MIRRNRKLQIITETVKVKDTVYVCPMCLKDVRAVESIAFYRIAEYTSSIDFEYVSVCTDCSLPFDQTNSYAKAVRTRMAIKRMSNDPT